MIRIRPMIFFASAAMAALSPALAADDAPSAPTCSEPAALPAELAGWNATRLAVQAAEKPSKVKAALLPLGRAADTSLRPTPTVKYAIPPAKPGGSVSFGGIFAFDVPEDGNYRVAINAHSWTDVIEGKVALPSIAHGHGPECTGVSKMVDYHLKAGRHLLQISANGDPKLTILVTRLP